MAKQDFKILPILQELIDSLRILYGAQLKRIILYGSYARGEATAESDLDVLIVLDRQLQNVYHEVSRLVPLIAELNLKYEVLPSCIPVSYEEYEKAKTPLLMNVRSEGIVVHRWI